MRRMILHIHGFDPRGPAFYHVLYRDEAAKQEQVTGSRLHIGPRQNTGPQSSSWTIESRDSDHPVSAVFEIQRWDDLVRANWPRSGWHVARTVLRYTASFLRSGMIRHVFRLQPRRILTVLFPIGALLSAVLLVSIAMCLILAAFQAATGWPNLIYWLALPLTLAATPAAVALLDRKTHLFWLARILAFTCDDAAGRLPELEQRKDLFADRLIEHVRSRRFDEVLVSGHSVGATLAVSAVGRALDKEPNLPGLGTALSLMTLGQSMPLVGKHPHAAAFRRELAACAEADGLTWIDISAGADPACFYRIDPVLACNGARDNQAPAGPKLVSARFHDLFSEETYRKLRKRKNLMHFCYLTATEKRGDYDFFAITAGAAPLETRFS